MNNCKDINNLRPAYLDDALSPSEKERVAEHLAVCSRCRQDVADLSKAVSLLHHLEEVEPPPFFEQRIMAAIREESRKKKSIWRRLFFPLHIKIPLQALTTVFIAVFAFLVYQKSGPEIKHVTPLPAPGSVKERIAPEISRQPSVPATAAQDGKAPSAASKGQNRGQFAPAPAAGEGKQDSLAAFPAPLREDHPAATALKDTGIAAEAGKFNAKGEAETISGPTVTSSLQSRKSKAAVLDAVRENRDMTAASSSLPAAEAVPAKRPRLALTIRVLEINQGLQDVEACLYRFNARILERRHLGEAILLKVQIDGRRIAAFVRQLENIGPVRTNVDRLEFPAGNAAVEIRIDRLP
jgi:signal recognition particle subunit SEC65